jgi:D-arabinan exo alpha-(1,3)/(1,5)-arabinofuranosidase (non-reducing end)
MNNRRFSCAVMATILAVCIMTTPAIAGKVTFRSLVDEMTDLTTLATFPDPSYTCKQFASYDRRSTDPKVLTDSNWFANGDAGKHIRVEERNGVKEWVMMDTDGPGAIVRIWSANADGAGIVRVYLNNSDTPTIEMPLTDMLNGKNAPFITPIAGIRSRGWNSHLPIPYSSHCKVTASKPRFYYQINYRTYEPGTKVEDFSTELTKIHADRIATSAAVLADPVYPKPPKAAKMETENIRLSHRKQWQAKLKGPRAIYRMAMKVDAADMERALRGCMLEISFDGASQPQVQVPLGDFTGSAPGLNTCLALPCGIDQDGTLYSNWVLPYKKSAKIKIVNYSGQTVGIKATITTGQYRWTKNSMHFHAKWRKEGPIYTRPRQDWTYMCAKGKGVFVGNMLNISNHATAWWGEGDEKIYVDGETFPSHFGTGTEDYYGYAWCSPALFIHAYHNQPRCDGPGNYGQTCVNRFHILDNIPFNQSFKFDMEIWHWAKCNIYMAAVSYWYAQPGGSDLFGPLNPSTLTVAPLPKNPPIKIVKGAIEGEKLKIISKSGGTTEAQGLDPEKFSRAKHLWWKYGKVGDTLVLRFPVKRSATYEIRAGFCTAPDYGIHQLYINGKKAGKPLDFYSRGVTNSGQKKLGVFKLSKGNSELKIEIAGKNGKAVPSYMFGLDYILLIAR